MSWKDLRARGIGGDASVGIDMPIASQEMRELLEMTRSLVDGLARDIALQARILPQNFRDGWTQFIINEWGPFYNAHQAMSLTDIVPGVPETLTRLYGQALAFRQSFMAYGGRPTTPLPVMPRPSSDSPSSSGFSNIVWGGLIVTGIFGVGYVLSKIPSSRSSE